MKIITICMAAVLLISIGVGCTSNSNTVSQSNQMNQTEQPSAQSSPTSSSKADPVPSFPVTVVDMLGRTVVIKKLPQRIVSLAPSNTELLFSLNLDDRIVGVTDYCDYPESAKTKPRVASYNTPNMEKITSIEPDLIIAESIHEKTALPALEKLGFTVVVLKATSINGILDNIELVGKITGKTQKAASLISDIKTKIDSVTSRMKTLDSGSKPRLLYVIWSQPLWSMGSKTFTNDLFTAAGAVNIFTSEFEGSRIVSLESVITANPQIIIVSGMGTSGEKTFSAIKNEPRLQVTDAIKNNRIYRISNSNIIERPGPRIVDGLQELSKLIHPEIFGAYK
jgi:iron complex transport system substrate-binding protein